MYTKYWQNLLYQWRKKGYDGLTIPYLIGAKSYFTDGQVPQTINELIFDIAESKDFEVYILYCMNIKELILGIRSSDKVKNAGKHLYLANGERSSFFLTKFLDHLGADLTEVCEALTDQFQNHIDRKNYSINNLEWGHYTSEDIEFIQECVESYNGDTI